MSREYDFLDALNLPGLRDLRAAVDALIAERLAEEDLGSTEPYQGDDLLPKSSNGNPTGRPRGAWIDTKMINGCGPYAYLRWREGGRCRSKYLGKVKGGERWA